MQGAHAQECGRVVAAPHACRGEGAKESVRTRDDRRHAAMHAGSSCCMSLASGSDRLPLIITNIANRADRSLDDWGPMMLVLHHLAFK